MITYSLILSQRGRSRKSSRGTRSRSGTINQLNITQQHHKKLLRVAYQVEEYSNN